MKRLASLSVFALVLGFSQSAFAQEFGSRGQLALSAERMFGLVYSRSTRESGSAELTESTLNFSLFSNPASSMTTNYAFPRIGLDYFLNENVSLGGAAAFFTSSISTEARLDGVEVPGGEDATMAGFLFAPRFGYVVRLSESIGLWLRGGITYVNISMESGDTKVTNDTLALTLEAPFVFQVAPHVAITAGPTLDAGVAGTSRTRVGGASTDVDFTGTDIGVQAGLSVYF